MKNRVRTILLLLGDILVLILSFYIMLFFISRENNGAELARSHSVAFLILGIFWLIIFFIFNLYETEKVKPTIPHLKQIVRAFITAFIFSIIFFYTIPFFKITPKTNLIIFSISGITLFIIWRRIFYNIFSSYFKQSVVFITDGESENPHVKDLIEYISLHPQSGFEISNTYRTVGEFLEQHKELPEVFIVVKDVWNNPENFKILYETQKTILDLSTAYEDIMGRIPTETIDEGWFMHNIYSDDSSILEFLEKVFSIIIAITFLIITSPLLLLIMLSIKIYDGGTIFYSQTRVGKNGKNFKLYKFRSMVPNAERNGPEWSQSKDTRVTPVGKVIRKIHLDEIPQFLNIIKGDITIVGPRPERPEFVDKLEKEIPFYYLRHTISPGFTGWAQIKFRYAGNVLDSKKKFEYDLYYLKNRSIFMDLGILIRTIQIIFTH